MQNEKGWLFYDAAISCWKEINKNLVGDKILDIGCGTGISLALSKVFNPTLETYGVEGDINAIALAKKRGIEIYTGNIEELNLKDNFFDTVFTSHVLEHLKNPKKMIEESIRVASKRIIHVVPDGDVESKNFGTPHLHVFNRKNFLKLFCNYENQIKDYYSISNSHMNSLIIVIDKK